MGNRFLDGAINETWVAGFSGVIAALISPLDTTGKILTSAAREYVDLVIESGVKGVMVSGSTGEFVAHSIEERKRILEAYIEAVAGRVPVVAHVGHVSSSATIELASHAVVAGSDAVCSITPYYFETTESATGGFFRAAAESAAGVPFFAYVYPRNATNDFSPRSIGGLRDVHNLAGVKCSVDSIERLTSYLTLEPHIKVVCGNDSLMPDFIAAGGSAFVSGNAAVVPSLIVDFVERILKGEWSATDQSLLADISVATRGGAPDRIKELINRGPLDVGPSRLATYDSAGADSEAAWRRVCLASEGLEG